MPDEVLEYTIRMNDQAARPTARLRQATRGLEGDMRRAAITGVAPLRNQLRGAAREMQMLDARMAVFHRGGIALAAASGALAGGMGMATREAIGFNREMRNWASLAKPTEQAFQGTSKAVLAMVKDPQVVDTPRELARGLYDIQSSGYEGAIALEALQIASKGAAAGLSDTATAADVLTSVGNAYGARTGPQLQRMMDIMFRTVDRGKVTFAELAQQIGPAAAAAAQAGVSFEELNAAYATMTIQGIDASESATALERLIVQFLDPPRELAKRFDEMGYASGLAALEANGLAGSVRLLFDAAGRDPAVLAQMGFSMRALRGMFALTGESAEMFTQNLQLMEDAGGATAAALEQQAKSAGFAWEHAKASLNASAIELGETFLPVVADIADGVSRVTTAFNDLPEPVQEVTAYVMAGTAAFTGLVAAETLVRVGYVRLQRELAEAGLMQGKFTAAEIAGTRAITAQTAAIHAQTVALRANAVAGGTSAMAGGFRPGMLSLPMGPSPMMNLGGRLGRGAAGAAGGAGLVGRAGGAIGRGWGTLSAAAPIMTNPYVIAAAASASMFWLAHKETVGKAVQQLDRTLESERGQWQDLHQRGFVGTYQGQRVDLEAAMGYSPTEGAQKALRRMNVRYARNPEKQRRELERVRSEEGQDAYNWLLAQYKETSWRQMTKEEWAQELVREAEQEQKGQKASTAAHELAAQQRPDLFGGMPEEPETQGQPQAVQMNFYAWSPQDLQRAIQQGVQQYQKQAFPDY